MNRLNLASSDASTNRVRGLSDRELVSRLRTLVKKEQTLTLEIIPHLVEVLRRGLYLGKGYGSLYEYCRGELSYTDASAWRRARAAQAIVRCPAAWNSLRDGAVSLCTLGHVYKFITPAVLHEISGKSKPEVELIAAAYDAKGVCRDRTRPVMVPKSVPAHARADSGSAEMSPAASPDENRLRSEVCALGQKDSLSLRGEVSRQPLQFEQKWKIEGVVSKEVKAKLDRCKSLLSRKYPHGVDYDILFGELAEVFLERSDPERKQERRKKRKPAQQPRAEAAPKARAQGAAKSVESRHIPVREKEKVWTRDKGRCTYVGRNGKRCNSKFNLQFDHHPIPFARGGPSNASNLRLLCAKHNRHTAKKTFGPRDYNNRPT